MDIYCNISWSMLIQLLKSVFLNLRLNRRQEPDIVFELDKKSETPISRAYNLVRQEKFNEAIDLLQVNLEIAPNDFESLCLLGEALARNGDSQEAVAMYRRALLRQPDSFDARSGLGLALFELGNYEDAYVQLKEAHRMRPKDSKVLSHLGLVALNLGNLTAAYQMLKQAVEINPDFAIGWNSLGVVAQRGGNRALALSCFQKAITLKPDFSTAWANCGLALREAEQLEAAIEHLREAVKLNPGSASSHLNLGTVLLDSGDLTGAESVLQQAIRIKPEMPDAYVGLGAVLQQKGESDQASSYFLKALELDPTYPEAMGALGELQLALGQYDEGWRNYEARLLSQDSPRKQYPYPEWHGEPLNGNSILIYGEQGLGDTIMFASCIPDVVANANRCTLECDGKLVRLFARSFPAVTVLPFRNMEMNSPIELEAFDFCAPIGNLPRYYRASAEAFPGHSGYLKADPIREQYWIEKLAEISGKPKIGVAWRGGLIRTGKWQRSFKLKALLPILERDDYSFISLQRTEGLSEIDEINNTDGVNISHWQDALDNFDETAALISALDLVITGCSTLVHLAGALGKPVWVLTPFSPAWRYMRQGNLMPWYPSARLFRQPSAGDWITPIAKVNSALNLGVR